MLLLFEVAADDDDDDVPEATEAYFNVCLDGIIIHLLLLSLSHFVFVVYLKYSCPWIILETKTVLFHANR